MLYYIKNWDVLTIIVFSSELLSLRICLFVFKQALFEKIVATKCKLVMWQLFSAVFMPWTVPVLKKLGVRLTFFDKRLEQYFIDMIEQILASRKAGDKVSIVMCSDECHKHIWIRQRLRAIRQQVIAWVNVDPKSMSPWEFYGEAYW